MNWKVNLNGYIEDENGSIVCMIPSDTKPEVVELIVQSPEMLDIISDFISEIDAGGLRAKAYYNKFKQIRDRIIP